MQDVTEIQSIYQQAIRFAAFKHSEKNQTIPGTNLPYVVHLSNVAMEILIAHAHTPNFRLGLAIQLALLHDTLEDTAATFAEIADEFNLQVAEGVSALTKNHQLPKAERMSDSLRRIQTLSKEVAVVKLADRITNLQEPPKDWDVSKKEAYQKEAIQIFQYLKGTNAYLEQRLSKKMEEYRKYI